MNRKNKSDIQSFLQSLKTGPDVGNLVFEYIQHCLYHGNNTDVKVPLQTIACGHLLCTECCSDFNKTCGTCKKIICGYCLKDSEVICHHGKKENTIWPHGWKGKINDPLSHYLYECKSCLSKMTCVDCKTPMPSFICKLYTKRCSSCGKTPLRCSDCAKLRKWRLCEDGHNLCPDCLYCRKGEKCKKLFLQPRKVFEKQLSEPWFSHVVSKRKTIEGRLNSGDWAQMKIGDCIKFTSAENKEQSVEVVVVSATIYPTFFEMLISEGLAPCLPGMYSICDGASIYRKFYSEEEERKNGAIAIRIK